MAASTEFVGDQIDVHVLAFRTQADADHAALHLLEDARHDHRFDRTDVVDQALALLPFRTGTAVIAGAQPEICDAVIVGQAALAVDMPEQPEPRHRVRVVHMPAHLAQFGAALDEVHRRPGRSPALCSDSRRNRCRWKSP